MSIVTYNYQDGDNSEGVTQGSTYDSTHGWVIAGWSIDPITTTTYDYHNEGDDENTHFLMEKTMDGKYFEPFPSLPDEGAACLETLDNGGDIFATGTGQSAHRAYIFKNSISEWKRLPDIPETRDSGEWTGNNKKNQNSY